MRPADGGFPEFLLRGRDEGRYLPLGVADDGTRLTLREHREAPKGSGRTRRSGTSVGGKSPAAAALQAKLDDPAKERLAALKAWRSEVAREHNLPAYIVFNDATLAQMALTAPATLDELSGISGVGAKKLEAYGREILRVLEA